MKMRVKVIGGGLAGSELALQLARRGIDVDLFEMRPVVMTPAHESPYLAELVCSNSLKSDNPLTASGLLKRELRFLGCRLLSIAEKSSVEAGHALAVDRELFASSVTEAIEVESHVSFHREEVTKIPDGEVVVVATGPLTSPSLSSSIERHLSAENLYFYDAISISVTVDSIDPSVAFRASRYGKGGEDYWNIPLNREEYERLVDFLLAAPKTEKRGFEDNMCFEGCLPIEVIAARGRESLRFGPLKPKGLVDPRTGCEPYAVVQLRKETMDGSIYGLVGFQTRLKRPAQRELLNYVLPGFEKPQIVRWGSIHRNTFINSPEVLDSMQMSLKRRGLFFTGQIVGVEGYMESIAHGLLTALNIVHFMKGLEGPLFPAETILGGLQRHLIEKRKHFQPMNANFGLLPFVKSKRSERKRLFTERALAALERFVSEKLETYL